MVIERALCPTLIGREDELSTLEDALLDAARGEGGVVVVGGDAGMGKTRVALQLRRQAAKLGCTTLWGSCSDAELSLPYLPFLEAIGNHLATTDMGDLRQRLGPSVRELSRLFPQLGVDLATVASGDPLQAKLILFEAVVNLLGTLAGQWPLLVVIEDLHWADSSTRELLDYVTRRVRSFPVLLLATCRFGEMDRLHPLRPTLQGWRRARLAETIELPPLEPDQVARMVCAILDEPGLSLAFRDYLYRRSEGNPFVIEEMMKEAIDRGDVFRSDARWERKSIAAFRVPETVRETILVRVERLESAQQAVLASAAVIGSSFDFATLVELSGVDPNRVEEILRTCIRQQLLEEDESQPGGFLFRHNLTWEVIYEDITAPRRVRLHDRVVDILGNAGAPKAERARHLLGANRPAEALPLFTAAAEEAVRRRAYLSAAELYERALPHITDTLSRARTTGALGDALWRAGSMHLHTAAEHLQAAVVIFEAAGAERAAAEQRVVLAHCYYDGGHRRAAHEQYEAARACLERHGPTEALAAAYLRLSALESHNSTGHWEVAARLAQQAIDTATSAQADTARIWAYNHLGSAIAEGGKTEEGLALLDRSYREAVEHDLDFVAANALNNSVALLFELTRARECPPLLDKMRALRHWFFSGKAAGFEGYIRLYLGELESGVTLLRQYLDAAMFPGLDQRLTRMLLAWSLCELGRVGEALEFRLPPNPEVERYDLVYEIIVWSRYHLALGTVEQAVPAVEHFITRFGRLPPGRLCVSPELPDALVAVLIATGEVERAARIAVEVEARGLTWSPWGKRARARVLLSGGRWGAAGALLAQAAEQFEEAEYRIAAIETRLLLSDALLGHGDTNGAVREVRQASVQAQACGAVRLAGKANEALCDLGIVDDAVTARQLGDDEHHQAPLLSLTTAPPHQPPCDGTETVLCAGVRGYTGVTARTPLNERANRVAALQRWAQLEVERRHGIVDCFASDAVTATFNGGIAAADHCLHAVQAAIALAHKAVLLDLPVGVGVAIGSAVAGEHPGRANTGAVETVITLATRLGATAQPGEVVVSGEAFSLVQDWVEKRGMASAPVLLTRKDGRRQVHAQLLRRGGGRATPGEAEEQLEVADAAWRRGRHEESGLAAARARDLAEQVGDAALVGRAVAALRRTGAIVVGAGTARGGGHVLSPRELEVATLVAEGMTNAEIARQLHISDRTAATHVGNILTKLDLRGRVQIARWAAEQRLGTSPPPS